MRFFPLLIAITVLSTTACGYIHSKDDFPRLILKDHALSGKIWDVKAKRFVSQEQIVERLSQSEYLLLGETHDNALHHEYQAWVINKLRELKLSSIVAFEMIDQSQGEYIFGKQYESADSLIAGLNHVKTSWGYERHYKIIFDNVLKAGYSIYPANLDRTQIMSIGRMGEGEVPVHIRPYLEKNIYTPEQEMALRNEIRMSHCGMDNPNMAKAMMLTQRVKDAVMADSLMRKANVDTRVLVAGSGHVRNDRGVPMYIQNENSKAKILAIAWLEVADELRGVAAYAEHWGGENLPFDYVWFTARVDRPDPCENFRRHMKKKNENPEKI